MIGYAPYQESPLITTLSSSPRRLYGGLSPSFYASFLHLAYESLPQMVTIYSAQDLTLLWLDLSGLEYESEEGRLASLLPLSVYLDSINLPQFLEIVMSQLSNLLQQQFLTPWLHHTLEVIRLEK